VHLAEILHHILYYEPPAGLAETVMRFGNAGVQLPLAALLAGWLVMVGARRAAIGWLQAVALCGITMVALKLLLLHWGIAALALHTPSGHAALTALVCGAVGLIVVPRPTGPSRVIAPALALGAVMAVSLSLLELGVHTPVEIVVGLAVASLFLAFTHRRFVAAGAVSPRVSRVQWGLLFLPAAAVVWLSYEWVFSLERVLIALAR
jgi:membrane-associated phospholipid phosphatase